MTKEGLTMEHRSEDMQSENSKLEETSLESEEAMACEAELEATGEPMTDADIATEEAAVSATDAVLTTAGGIVVKKSVIAIACVLIAALTVGSLFLGMLIYHLNSKNLNGIDPGAKDYHSIYVNAGHAGDDEITIPGYSDVFFPAGETDVQIVLLNPDGNPCYFRFSMILSETDEELYRSGLIPPGMAVTDIELNRALEAGEYALRIRIETFSLSDRSEMNGADLETKLKVIQ
jgi:hypothetical protein